MECGTAFSAGRQQDIRLVRLQQLFCSSWIYSTRLLALLTAEIKKFLGVFEGEIRKRVKQLAYNVFYARFYYPEVIRNQSLLSLLFLLR